MTLNLALIPGDGTGPEVVGAAVDVLKAAAPKTGLDFTTTTYPFSAQHYLDTGHVLTDEDIATLRQHDAILLGAVGGLPNDPRLAGGVIEKGILLKMRFDLDLYINLRPVKLYPGVETPLKHKTSDDIDFVVVRENTEDLYAGSGGVVRRGTPQELAVQDMIATRFGVERCIRYAFKTAQARKAAGYEGKLTLVHKTNVLTFAGDVWYRAFEEVGAEFPDIVREYHHVDACCMYLVSKPEIYDVIVTANMFGDIVTDLGAAIAGGMGIAASGNLNPDPPVDGKPRAPSFYEPVHGSSPDIAGQDKANPLATIDSLSLLLTETGRLHADEAMVKAGENISAATQKVTPNFAGKSLDRSGYATTEITKMVIEALG